MWEIYIISFWRGFGLFLVCLAVLGNVGMPETFKFMIDYEYQEKKEI
jgi:hypothetical protein